MRLSGMYPPTQPVFWWVLSAYFSWEMIWNQLKFNAIWIEKFSPCLQLVLWEDDTTLSVPETWVTDSYLDYPQLG